MMATDKRGLQGTRCVRKETGWLTNGEDLAELLQGECTNKTGGEWHRHIHLIGGISRAAAEYPAMLVKAVLRWLKAELVRSGELGSTEANTSEEPFVNQREFAEWYWDDVN